MAKKTPAKSGRSLVIVESPAKARTISRFLGRSFQVEASIGHVRDLPQGKKQLPDEFKKEDWAELGVNVNDGFTPVYIVPPGKREQVAKLKKAMKEADRLYLATDEDREGEAISWHLHELLNPKIPVHRLVFHEITESAIKESLEHPRSIDGGMVKAQETRRILDRLYGYPVSKLLWFKIGPGLSAGRVQSVALRLIVDCERERMAFKSASYWDLLARFATKGGSAFQAELVSVGGRRVPSGKDFDAATGQIKDPQLLTLNETEARELAARLARAVFEVSAIDERPYSYAPSPPFTTSTLQQEANRKLGFTARRTMDAAQGLYENGHITYMRTDSTTLAQVAVEAARNLVRSEYGGEFLPDAPRKYESKVKNAQEAHEAIRPAGHPFEVPQLLRGQLPDDQYRLFELIWKRTIASQMVNCRGRNITITLSGDGAVFKVTGRTIDFAGYLRAYVEGSDDPQAELADRETVLPSVETNERVDCREMEPKGHSTQPPPRYSEAALTKELEERGIGRPSTYASIIDTIQARSYVFKKGNALVPTWTAFSVLRLLEQHLPKLVDYRFTAQMEDFLDSISRGEAEAGDYLREFYLGAAEPGLKPQLEQKLKEIDPRLMSRFPVGADLEGHDVVLRVGRYGPFLEAGTRRASLPDGMAPDELTLPVALDLLEKGSQSDEPLGTCPATGKPVFLKQGRFGPYVQLGTRDEDEKPKQVGLVRGLAPEQVTLEVALQLLALPRDLGPHPTLSESVAAFNGRFGPYIKCGAETRSLPAGMSPLNVTLEQAVELLAQPKYAKRGRGTVEPLKTFDASPVTSQPIKLLAGRYGLYVADGETNASLPKDLKAEDCTFEQAVQLLAERAAKGPSKGARRGAKRKTAKSAAKKKATKKKPEVVPVETGESPPPKKAKAKKPAKKAKKKSAPRAAKGVSDEIAPEAAV